jgi:ribosomal protein S18 acetylase RimI-like enzyme
MNSNLRSKIEIVELHKDDSPLPTLRDKYVTDSYYDLTVTREPKAWRAELNLKPFENPQEKSYTGRFFEEHIVEPRVFAAVLDGEQVGWVELGYDKWNNRMRVWEFLVKEEHRRRDIGTALMEHAIAIAKQKGARMLVLETQSCNVPAIDFYLKQGFGLIGFDLAAYSNEDIRRKEVRLEFGLML